MLVLRRHDFIEMDLVVEVVVILEATEGFEHFLDLTAQVLDQ